MLEELAQRRRAARSVENTRLLALRWEQDRATKALNLLYKAVEQELLPMDDTLRARAQKHKASRAEAMLEIAKLEDRKLQAVPKVDSRKIEAFTKAPEARLKDSANGFGKAYLRTRMDEIRLEGNELKISGSYAKLSDVFGMLKKKKLGEVPSFIRDWCARQDETGPWVELVSVA